jgi:NAD(P)-dependent dehydrogenase (short-subunit alcohol dehydrogenase family)
VTDPLHAYQLSKRGNSLRVMAEAVRWAKRGARINTISPGIIMTPLARDELSGPRGAGYRRMIEESAAGRAGRASLVVRLWVDLPRLLLNFSRHLCAQLRWKCRFALSWSCGPLLTSAR